MIDLKVRFNPTLDKEQYHILHPKVHVVFEMIAMLWDRAGYDAVITSMVREAGQIPGESGVHATGRALDCIPVWRGARPAAQMVEMNRLSKAIAYCVNMVFRRVDRLPICLWHDSGYGRHMHIQAPWDKKYKDLNAKVERDD